MRHSANSAESDVAAAANDLRTANGNRVSPFWNCAFCTQAQELVLQDDHRAIVAYRGVSGLLKAEGWIKTLIPMRNGMSDEQWMKQHALRKSPLPR